MQALRQFSIPLKGLKNGEHNYAFNIDKTFFACFESAPIGEGQLTAELSLEKKSDHIILDFWIEGSIRTECDRCTALIDLPIESEHEIIVKYSDEEKEEDEIVYIPNDAHELNVASLIYELIILAIPMIKVYDCDIEEPRPCNEEILSILSAQTKESKSPLGDALKNLKLDKN
jgi:uncharacterized metal-binding protein YceD (DUF177 family)